MTTKNAMNEILRHAKLEIVKMLDSTELSDLVEIDFAKTMTKMGSDTKNYGLNTSVFFKPNRFHLNYIKVWVTGGDRCSNMLKRYEFGICGQSLEKTWHVAPEGYRQSLVFSDLDVIYKSVYGLSVAKTDVTEFCRRLIQK